MTSPLANLEPRSLWQHFDMLRQIPRPSRQEERVREHVKQWAAKCGFGVREDRIGNVCVAVPATKGHESAPIVVLQGHLDMVAEKDKSTDFDFDKDAIPVRVDGDWVVADHTTLGADNGIGVAAAMASADDPSVVHGPLELLFTIDEETALTGASELDPKLVNGRIMLNLDSEEDGVLFVGCAGGCTTEIEFKLDRAAAPSGMLAVNIEVTGLKGGHSGLAIHENRGNSLKALARVLSLIREKHAVLLDTIEGGNKHNAIPREASATVLVPAAAVAGVKKIAAAVCAKMLTEIKGIDPGLEITVAGTSAVGLKPASQNCTDQFVKMLIGLPHGVIAMSRDIVGLTETSTNVAVIRTTPEKIEVTTSSRSSVDAALRFTLDQANAVIELAGGKWTEVSAYPGWQPDMASELLRTCREVFRELRGREPKITAIHAGLECGIIGEKLGGADMISYGPWMEGVHAPGERLNIPSARTFWEFHKSLLARLA